MLVWLSTVASCIVGVSGLVLVSGVKFTIPNRVRKTIADTKILSGKEQNQPSSFSELWPIGSSLVLYELKEGDDPEEQIVTGLSREQIESRIFAIRSWLSGSPVQADFVEQLRLSGFHWKGSVFVSSTQNTPASPHPPVGDIRKDGFQRCDDGYSFFFNIPNASAQLPKVS